MLPLLCFDWDGVLADSMGLCIAETRETLRQMHLPDLPDDVLRACNGPTYEQAVDILHIPHDRVAEYMAIRRAAGLALTPTVNRLFPGVREMLDTLRGRARLCVVSNGERNYVALCLKIFQLEGIFSHVITAVPGRTKADNLRTLLLDVQPERAVMIGDRLSDFQAGKACSLPTMAACYGYGCEEEYQQADWRAQTVQALSEMLVAFCDQGI